MITYRRFWVVLPHGVVAASVGGLPIPDNPTGSVHTANSFASSDDDGQEARMAAAAAAAGASADDRSTGAQVLPTDLELQRVMDGVRKARVKVRHAETRGDHNLCRVLQVCPPTAAQHTMRCTV